MYKRSDFKNGDYIYAKNGELEFLGRILVKRKNGTNIVFLCQDEWDCEEYSRNDENYGYGYLTKIEFDEENNIKYSYCDFNEMKIITEKEYNKFYKTLKVKTIAGYEVKRNKNKITFGCGRVEMDINEMKELIQIIKPIVQGKFSKIKSANDLYGILDIIVNENDINITNNIIKRAERYLNENNINK